MCALACHLHTNADTDEIEQLGLSFSDAARSEIEPDDGCLTTIQALAVMFLVDCARGRGLRASSYLNLASRSLSNVKILQDDGFLEVVRDTTQGIRSLNMYVCLDSCVGYAANRPKRMGPDDIPDTNILEGKSSPHCR